MKLRHTFFLLLISLGINAQTIFVNKTALGLNNGTSWLDAYVSLDAALAVALPGQSIWVAAGTYKPQTPAPNHSFILGGGVKMYGGFAGTETAISQRNLAGNQTILSGDILGNDVAGNFTLNRTDNSRNVLIAVVLTENTGCEVDGFTISNGNTLVGSTNPELLRMGGGLLAGAKVTVRNCKFTANYGELGAAMAAVDALSDGVVIEYCIFEGNQATSSGICLLRNTPTGTVKNTIFRNNLTNRGCLYPSATTDIKIESCLFESNNAGTNFGGAMFTWQASYTVTNCIFRKNKAANAAGIYIDNRDGGDVVNINNCHFENDTTTGFGGSGIYAWQATFNMKNCTFKNNHAPNAAAVYCNGREFDSSFNIEDCTFEGNTASNYGGTAIYNNKTNYTMSGCIFKNNTAPSSGAAIYHSDTTVFVINNCLFEGNKGSYAAAVANYGIGCKGTFDGCTFKNNQATQGGGACSNGFKADILYKNCDFLENKASFGAAIFTQNDTTRLRVDGSYFADNNATGTAGCILVNSRIAASIKNSTFFQNTGGTGGAISANGDSLVIIDKCSFLENISTTQGGAINFNNAKSNLTNCLFAKNVNTGAAGGAIICNASDNTTSVVKAVNCTFADNFAAIGAGIAQWEGPLGDAKLSLLNCLFQNTDGDNYAIEEGMPEVISLGGNQSSDATLELSLTASKDLNNTSNNFPDADSNNYAPSTDSPAADGGVAAGAPTTDINGVSRAGTPDVGCYEVKTSGTNNPGLKIEPLQFAPNPAVEQTLLSLSSRRLGRLQISVWNQLGQQVLDFIAEKTGEAFSFPLNVGHLPTGNYKVQVRSGAEVFEGAFVKS